MGEGQAVLLAGGRPSKPAIRAHQHLYGLYRVHVVGLWEQSEGRWCLLRVAGGRDQPNPVWFVDAAEIHKDKVQMVGHLDLLQMPVYAVAEEEKK